MLRPQNSVIHSETPRNRGIRVGGNGLWIRNSRDTLDNPSGTLLETVKSAKLLLEMYDAKTAKI